MAKLYYKLYFHSIFRIVNIVFLFLIMIFFYACFNPEPYISAHIPANGLKSIVMRSEDGNITKVRISWPDSSLNILETTHLRVFRRHKSSFPKDSIYSIQTDNGISYIEDEGLVFGENYTYTLFGKNSSGYSLDSLVHEHLQFFAQPKLNIRQLSAGCVELSSNQLSSGQYFWELIDSLCFSNISNESVYFLPGDSSIILGGFKPNTLDSIYLTYFGLGTTNSSSHKYEYSTNFPAVENVRIIKFNNEIIRTSWSYNISNPDTFGVNSFRIDYSNGNVRDIALTSQQQIAGELHYISYMEIDNPSKVDICAMNGEYQSIIKSLNPAYDVVDTGYHYIDLDNISGFYISSHELTNKEFLEQFSNSYSINDTTWLLDEDFNWSNDSITIENGRDDFPLRAISYEKSETIFGNRIPTEEEWENAARAGSGDINRSWPWGDDFPDRYHCCFNTNKPVVAFPSGEYYQGSVFLTLAADILGPVHMSGNVGEWVQGGIIKGGYYGSVNVNDLKIVSKIIADTSISMPQVGIRLKYK